MIITNLKEKEGFVTDFLPWMTGPKNHKDKIFVTNHKHTERGGTVVSSALYTSVQKILNPIARRDE